MKWLTKMELSRSPVGVEDGSEGGVPTFLLDTGSVGCRCLLVLAFLEELIAVLLVGLGPPWRRGGGGGGGGGRSHIQLVEVWFCAKMAHFGNHSLPIMVHF